METSSTAESTTLLNHKKFALVHMLTTLITIYAWPFVLQLGAMVNAKILPLERTGGRSDHLKYFTAVHN